MQRQQHRSRWQELVAMATAFMPASSRSGGMSALSSFSPRLGGFEYRGPQTIHGRHRHASEVRLTKKRQRRRKFLRQSRG